MTYLYKFYHRPIIINIFSHFGASPPKVARIRGQPCEGLILLSHQDRALSTARSSAAQGSYSAPTTELLDNNTISLMRVTTIVIRQLRS